MYPCLVRAYPWIMEPDAGALQPLQITDEDVNAARPAVRALWMARLEAMWEPVKLRLQMDAEGAMPMDPRMLEIGLRIAKTELDLYGMFRAVAPKPEEEDELPGEGVDRRAMVEQHLAAIEQKLRAQ